MWPLLVFSCATEPDGGAGDATPVATEDCGEDATFWYPDDDGDGWGVPGTVIAGCVAIPGYALTADDCDDSNPDVHPEAGDDTCDDIDQDCDGLTDEDAPEAVDWYADADGDGHGAAAVSLRTCIQPAGYVATLDDCDDGDGSRHPGGDLSCEGWATQATAAWGSVGNGDADDAVSASLGVRRNLDGAGANGLMVTFAEMGTPEGDVTATWVLTAAVAGHNPLDEAAYGPLTGLSAGESLRSAVWAPDWDGDGVDDLAVVAIDADGDEQSCVVPLPVGAVSAAAPLVCWVGEAEWAGASGVGRSSGWLAAEVWGTVHVLPPGTAGGALHSAGVALSDADSDSFGYGLAEAGDVDGDGVYDLYATVYADAAHPDGAVYVLLGPFNQDRDVAAGDHGIPAPAGARVRDAGDVDGDGRSDLLVEADWGEEEAAGLHVNPQTAADLNAPVATLYAPRCEVSFRSAGDLDSDGFGDLAATTYGCTISQPQDGALFVLRGPFLGTRTLESADAVIVGDTPGGHFGAEQAPLGDYNGDGLGDLAVWSAGSYTAPATADLISLVSLP